MERSLERAQRTYIKISVGIVLGLVAFIGVCWGGHAAYVRWQERRLIRVAVTALAANDLRAASLAARKVLDLEPGAPAASRVMAELSERAGDKIALDWRRKVAQAEPNSAPDLLALTRSAVQFNQKEIARAALASASEEARKSAPYHAAQATLAAADQNQSAAEAEWAEAAKLDPNEPSYRLEYALASLRSSDPKQHDAGVETLTKARNDKQFRVGVTRALIADRIAQHAPASEIVKLARELKDYPEANFGDRLLFLDLLHQSDSAGFSDYLATLEAECADNPAELNSLLAWMSDNGLNLLAIHFAKTLPPGQIEAWPVRATIVQIYSRLAEWSTVDELTKTATWPGREYLRHAYRALALREEDELANAEREWHEALKMVSGNGEALTTLMNTVSKWRWEHETIEVLWEVAEIPDKQGEALATLYQHYRKTSDTAGLYRVLRRLAEVNPNNFDILNNRAQVALLLDIDTNEARKTAEEVYQHAPQNVAYATTYAYALWKSGDTQAALNLMNSFKPEQLNDPSIGVYYGIFLAEMRDERAREYLNRAKEAALLPEETQQVERALARLHASSTQATANRK